MSVSVCLAAAAVLVSATTMGVAVLNHLFTRRAALVAAQVERNRVSNQMLREDAALLALHGITAGDLAAAGVTAGEVLYLAHSFEAGAAYHALRPPWAAPRLTPHRRHLLRQPKVRLVWRAFLTDRLISRDAFSAAVDRFITEVEVAAAPPPRPHRGPHATRPTETGRGRGEVWREDAGARVGE